MKKAKVVLAAVTLFTLFSGLFAFRVRQAHVFYMTNPNDNYRCNLATTLNFTTTIPGVGIVTYLSTAPTNTTCPLTWITASP
jgi:hypothetical protein